MLTLFRRSCHRSLTIARKNLSVPPVAGPGASGSNWDMPDTADGSMTIGEVSELLGVAPSTLRWWERQGLIAPAQRRSGRRLYSRAEIRTLAIIRIWQASGQLSLDDIAVMLAGRDGSLHWHDVVRAKIADCEAQMERLAAAKRYLEFALPCHRDNPVADCPCLAEEVDKYLVERQTSSTR
ncbi:MerR family transcriptional regulator [Nocardia arthritidis]|uniref:MerR family transcriptional regulator n=2 Tax=Nocardiaceae TaxID=85025 RepID=A0A6G9Y954_9NOCA|nr:MerR family transcriptional regulator [Nocardia arthritidis]